MSQRYDYYNLDGIPCRVELRGEGHGNAEIYKRGVGFLPGPKSDILWNGSPIKKRDFDAMILALATQSNAEQ